MFTSRLRVAVLIIFLSQSMFAAAGDWNGDAALSVKPCLYFSTGICFFSRSVVFSGSGAFRSATE
jgi:hypothetical protein